MTGTSPPWWQTRWFVAAALLITAVPLLWPIVPPLSDLPGHMGRYRVMLGTDAAMLDRWYRFAWRPIGYLGVDLSVAALAPVFGLEPSVKAIAIAIPVLTVSGLLWLSREAHGRVQPTVLLALPFAYNIAFQYGFLNYTLAMALALNAFALWLRLGRTERTGWRAALFVPIAWIVWTAHLFGWLLLGVMASAAEIVRQRKAGKPWRGTLIGAAIHCAPLALPFVMLIGWRPGDGQAGTDWRESLALKPSWLVMALRDRWRWFDIVSTVTVAVILYRAVRTPRFGHAPALSAAMLGLTIVFVLMPFGSAYADARIVPYIWMLAVLAIRCDPGVRHREQAVLALIGLVFFGARSAATTISFAMESRVWDRHLAALDHVPRGSRLLTFVGAACDQPWRMARTVHLPGMAIVRRAAFSNDQFDLGSTALLSVTAPGLAGFAADPSQIVMERPCPQSPEFRTFDQAMRQFPHDRFDYLWLIDPPPSAPPRDSTLQLIWTDGNDRLFKLVPSTGVIAPPVAGGGRRP